jgi:hypothetical protein
MFKSVRNNLMIQFLFIASLLFLGSGCSDKSYSDWEKRFVDYVSNNPNEAPDYWLIKANAFGGPVKVSLVFGYSQNLEICGKFAKLLTQDFGDNYICSPAN